MDDRITLTVTQATNEDKTKFYEENPWLISPNYFLIRVIKYLYKDDKQILSQVKTYEDMSHMPRSETIYSDFKQLEKYLIALSQPREKQ